MKPASRSLVLFVVLVVACNHAAEGRVAQSPSRHFTSEEKPTATCKLMSGLGQVPKHGTWVARCVCFYILDILNT